MKRATDRSLVAGAVHLLAILLVILCAVEAQAQAGRRNQARGLTPNKEAPRNAGEANSAEAEEMQRQADERIVPLGIANQQRRVLMQIFERLDLSVEQRQQLMNVRRTTGRRLDVLNRLRRAQNEALDEALYGADFDPAEVEKRAADLAATSGEIIRLQASIISGMRQIMTPEQSARFRELLQEELRRRPAFPPRQQPNNPE